MFDNSESAPASTKVGAKILIDLNGSRVNCTWGQYESKPKSIDRLPLRTGRTVFYCKISILNT